MTTPSYPVVQPETLTAREIYERFKVNPKGEVLDAAIDTFSNLAGRYDERIAQIQALRARMDAAWRGTASDAAQSTMTPLIDTFDKVKTLLDNAKNALENQYSAFADVNCAVVPVPATPPTSGTFNDLWPFTTDTDRAITAYHDNASTNQRAYATYITRSADNAADIADFYPYIDAQTVPPATLRQPSGEGIESFGGNGPRPQSDTASSAGVATPATTAQAANDSPSMPPPGHNPRDPRNSTPEQTGDGSPWAGDGWGGLDPASAAWNDEHGAVTGSPRSVGPGFDPADADFGPVGLGGGRLAARGGSAGGPEVRPWPGQEDGNSHWTGSRLVPTGGAAGAGDMPVPAAIGRGANRGEDAERTSRYVVGPDPRDLFGIDEPTAPAVIGGDDWTPLGAIEDDGA